MKHSVIQKRGFSAYVGVEPRMCGRSRHIARARTIRSSINLEKVLAKHKSSGYYAVNGILSPEAILEVDVTHL